MLETLIDFDKEFFLFLHDKGHPYLDSIMWWLSNRYIWFPMYALLIYRLYQKHGKLFYQPMLALVLVILITDQATASLMKPFFERLRPCHNPELKELVSLVGNCGGKFSFASSHAANTFGLAGFFYFLEKSRLSWILIGWASLVSYSRIYLGVHFPADILVGAIIGFAVGWATLLTLRKIRTTID